MKSKKIILSVFALLLVILGAYRFRGAVLAYSPLLLLQCNETEYSVIYKGGATDVSYLQQQIDSMVYATELIHGLKFKKKVQIVILGSDNDFFTTYSSSYSMATFLPNGRILIPPSMYKAAAQNKDRLERFMMHELSHSILIQNMSCVRALTYPQWLFEGLAVYVSQQLGRDGLKRLTAEKIGEVESSCCRKGAHYTLISGMKNISADHVRSCYSLWGSKVSLLIAKHGKKRFFDFMRESLETNEFDEVYASYFAQRGDTGPNAGEK